MKKLIALFLSLVMAAGLAVVPASAEMITIEVPASTLIDQSFAGPLTEVPAGWTLAGIYSFGANGIRSTNYSGFTIYKNELFDAGGADYTFSAKFAHNGGTNYLHFGASTVADAIKDGVSDTGYTLKIERASNYKYGIYTIYKNGAEIGALTDANTSYGFQSNRVFTFVVTSDGLTVTGAGDTFTYADAEPIRTGYAGIKLRDNNGNKGNLASMSLTTEPYSYEIEKPAEVVTGAYASYETPGRAYMEYDFRGAEGIPAGVTPGAGYSLGASGLTWSGNVGVTTKFGAVTVPDSVSEFTVEASYTAFYNNSPEFNFLGYTLEKVGKFDGDKTYTLKKGDEVIGTGVIAGSSYAAKPVPVKILFKDNLITVNVNGNEVIKAEDKAFSKTGDVSVYSGYTGNWGIGYARVSSPATVVSKSSFLLDKTFSVADTAASVAEDGYTVSGASGYETGKGIYKSADGSLSAYYNGSTFSGAYTIEVTAAKNMNNGTVYFNRADSKNHYSVTTKSGSATSGTLSIKKTVDGTETSLLTDESGTAVNTISLDIGTNSILTSKITLEPLDTGDLRINVSLTNYEGKVRTFTVTDTNTPFTSGTFGYANSYSGKNDNRILSFKVYPNVMAENAVYSGAFNVNGNDVTEFTKGATVFKFPVSMLGQTPDFIAALYEDDEMTEVKLFDVYDMNNGIVSLFDTSTSTAEDIMVRLYTWNRIDGLVPILNEFELK